MTDDRATEARRLAKELAKEIAVDVDIPLVEPVWTPRIEELILDAEARGRAEGAQEIDRLNERLEELETYMRRIRDEEE